LMETKKGWVVPQHAPPPYHIIRELLSGGLANCIASAFLNPMDVTKLRLQNQALEGSTSSRLYRGFSHCAVIIVKEEGILGLWKHGMVASMMREWSYSSIRMGLYPPIKKLFGADTGDIGFAKKVLAGLTTGAIGSGIATPTDLVKIRFQSEAGRIEEGKYVTGLRAGHVPRYRNTLHAFYSIYKDENGIRGLYKGVGPTMVRAATLTATQLSTYDHSKVLLKKENILEEGFQLHIVASLISGLCATTVAAPADLVKSRLMADAHGDKRLYHGSLDCLIKTIRTDGVFGLFRGWVPSYSRLGPHFIIALPILEQTRNLMGLGYL